MTPPKTNLTLTIELPCGCVLSGQLPSAKPKTPLTDGKNSPAWETIHKKAGAVSDWLEDRWGRHDCNLVSSSNPNGLNPRK